MATKLTAARQLTRYAAERYDSDERCDIEAGLAKLFASEVAMKVALTALGHVKVRLCSRYGVSARTQVRPPGCPGVDRLPRHRPHPALQRQTSPITAHQLMSYVRSPGHRRLSTPHIRTKCLQRG